MNKLRKEIRDHYNQLISSKTERINKIHEIKEPSLEKCKMIKEIVENKKMSIDEEKLSKTIEKATVPIKKREIVVIDFLPKNTVTDVPVKKEEVKICQAKNLNGTPCKCRAKIGKFCAKHAP